ncbi:MAG: hypothetical protein QM758_20590 [Armatimonas sp.]
MLPALLATLCYTLGGAALTLIFVRRMPLLERLAIGVPAGNALFGLSGLLLAHLLGMKPVAILLALVVALSPLLILRNPDRRKQLSKEWRHLRRLGRFSPARVFWWLFYAVFATTLILFFRGALFFGPSKSYETANWANMGDVAYHLAIIEGFLRGENFPPEHPEFAGARLTYPFLVDFIAGESVVLGANIPDALFVQNVALITSFGYLLHRFALRVSGKVLVASLIVPIALFSGGWGFLRAFEDLHSSTNGLLDFLRHLPHDYTNEPELGYRWGNMLCVLLGTQRSIVLGLPTGMAVWLLWWRARGTEPNSRADGNKAPTPAALRAMTLAGALCGFLPLGHVHTLLVMIGLGGLWLILSGNWRLWRVFFTALLIVGLPCALYIIFQSQTETEPFRRFHPGWDYKVMSDDHMNALFDKNVGVFTKLGYLLASLPVWMQLWLKNTGLTLPLLAVALFSSEEKPIVPERWRRFYLPTLLLFVFANLIQLAPWPWDNIKVLIWWHLATVLTIACLLNWMWERKGFWRVLVPISFVVLTLAGALDVTRVVTRAAQQNVYTAEESEFAELIVKNTPPRSRFVTAPTYNSAVYLSGRRVIAGYYGHLWSHGLNSLPREADMKAIYSGAPNADEMIRKWNADYLVVGPHERGDPAIHLNEAYLSKFPVIAQTSEHRLFKLH